mmetsp:Transcript_11759/g.17622  ORF Transcript_11759/g.17622 Transcript_11759/m.17622 type:complete len:228 (-) Transcript_11759:1421-2104(-)
MLFIHQQSSKFHVRLLSPSRSKPIQIQTLQGKLKIRHLNLLHGSIRISHHMLDSLNHTPLQRIIHSRPPIQPPHTSPELGQPHPSRPILMRNQILPRCINIPSMSPSPHRQCNLLPHETPRDEGIKRNIHQKLCPREKESSSNKRNLGRPRLRSIVTPPGINPHNRIRVFHLSLTITQSRTRRFPHGIPISRTEPRRIGRKHRLGKRFGSLDFIPILLIPLHRKLKM